MSARGRKSVSEATAGDSRPQEGHGRWTRGGRARRRGAALFGAIAASALAAASVVIPAPAARAEGEPPIAALCPLVRGGTRVVCRLPEDTCDSGLVTLYAACLADTASDSSPGRSVEIGMMSALGEFRPVPRPCFDEVPVYRCSCTPLGDYCALGSACKRTAVLAGTVIPAGGFQLLVRCQPTVVPARRPGEAGDA